MTSEEASLLQVTDRLKRAAREGHTFDAAQITVIGLGEIRHAAGPEWPRMKYRVHANSLNFLRRRLGENDLVIPCGDGFIVLYDEIAERNLATESEHMKNALNAFYLGEEGMQRLSARVSPRRLDAKNVVAMIAAKGPESNDQDCRDVGFTPVWSVRRELFASYYAVPIVAPATNFPGYDPAYRLTGGHEESYFVPFDLKILDRVIVRWLGQRRPRPQQSFLQ